MPPIVIPPGYGELSVHYSVNGRVNAVNLLGVKIGLVPVQSDMDTLTNTILTALKATLTVASSTTACHLLFNNAGTMQVLDSISGHAVGTKAGEPCPPAVQVLGKKTTALMGRKHRGRSFFANVLEAHVGALGDIDGTEQAAYQSMLNAWGPALLVMPFEGLVILHHDATTPTPVTGWNIEPMVATLRRRMVR
jgi:hypothetical protein